MQHRITYCLSFLFLSVVAAPAADKPNIIYIMSDDMGFSDIGCYGSEIETPHLDSLAAGGVRFTQFYNTARCCPTRASLLSGLYPHQAGVGHMMNDRGHDGYRGDLNRSCVTIAEALKPAGYKTYMSGKWHVTKVIKPQQEEDKNNWPMQRGFDRFYGTIHGAGSFFDPNTLTRGNQYISPYDDSEYTPGQMANGEYYYTDAIADHATRFITEHHNQADDQPFFLYVSFTAAHWPMHALPKDIEKYEGKYDGGYDAIRNARYKKMVQLGLVDKASTVNWAIPDDWKETTHWEWDKRNMEVYAAMVDSMDQGIGRIIEALKNTGQFENTLICFFQDNGGCAENYGRGGVGRARAEQPELASLADDYLQPDMTPKQSRDGFKMRTGKGSMAGPADTAIGYGRGWATVSNTPFREYKHWVHEGGVSTPLIAHWPSKITRQGELESTPGHLIDLMATAVDIAEATYPKVYHDGQAIKPMEGKSLVPAFLGQPLERDAIYWEHEGNRAIRVGDYKLVAKGEKGRWELYDISKDRSEQTDLSEAMPDLAEELAEKWMAYATRANVLPINPKSNQKADKVNRKQRRFVLRQGDDLARDVAPFVQKRSFELVANVKVEGDGVVVAQGGVTHGWALYIQNGELCFAKTQNGERKVIESGAKPTGEVSLTVSFSRQGKVAICVDGQEVKQGDFQSALSTQPLDGLQIGQDTNGNVGDYESPFPIQGKVKKVILELE
ncbi:MAG: arylsulfatase [Rubripirellula sp.]|nr:arylsulfatase [Rubripirellula sp.]